MRFQSSQWSGPACQAWSSLWACEVAGPSPGPATVVAASSTVVVVGGLLASNARTSLVATDADGTAMACSPPPSAAAATIADPPASVAVNAAPAIARNTTLFVCICPPLLGRPFERLGVDASIWAGIFL